MSSNPRANVFILVNLGCEALYVIDQRLKAQQITHDKSLQVIHDVTTVLLEPKFIESLINGSTHSNAQLLTAEHCKFMLNDIATCSLMRLDETSMDKLWNLMTIIYKWQLFMSQHQHNLLDITFRHLDGINRLYPDPKRHSMIDYSKNTLLDFWNACGEEHQLSMYRTNKAWLECFNTKISLLMRLGFQATDGSFVNNVNLDHYLDYVQSIGDNLYVKANELDQQRKQQQKQLQQREPNCMDQLAAQLNINTSQNATSEDLQPIDADQFQKQLEQTFSNVLFADFENPTQSTTSQHYRNPNASSGFQFVQVLSPSGQPDAVVTTTSTASTSSSTNTGAVLNQQLLDLYSKMN